MIAVRVNVNDDRRGVVVYLSGMPKTGFIFLHGFMGRAETGVLGLRFEYFRGLRGVAKGFDIAVEVPQMPARTGIDDRARAIKPVFDNMDADAIVLVGNSMGGLVARALAARFDPERRVRVVASICTPHHGSPVADRTLSGESRFPGFVVRFLEEALNDLSVANAPDFNARTPDRPDVRYLSWASARPNGEMPRWFKKREAYIAGFEGENDGLVSVASSKWGTFIGTDRADHIETIGWSPAPADPDIGRPFDQQGFWRRVIERCLAECISQENDIRQSAGFSFPTSS